MARLTVPSTGQTISNDAELADYLSPLGITYEQWSTEATLGEDPTNDEILAAYSPQIDALKRKGGYQTADVINVTPETPNLQAMLDRFNKEHTHAEDEVRFVVKGRGIFHLNITGAPIFAIEMIAGDLINVPAGTRHWFDLCNDRTIRAIRLFRDPTGWSPEYISAGFHNGFEPLCLGPAYIPPSLPRVGNVLQPVTAK